VSVAVTVSKVHSIDVLKRAVAWCSRLSRSLSEELSEKRAGCDADVDSVHVVIVAERVSASHPVRQAFNKGQSNGFLDSGFTGVFDGVPNVPVKVPVRMVGWSRVNCSCQREVHDVLDGGVCRIAGVFAETVRLVGHIVVYSVTHNKSD
jgi:hypothetical protein